MRPGLLLAYAVFCWLVTPAVLIALGVHGQRRLAQQMLGVLVILTLVRQAVEAAEPARDTVGTFIFAITGWACMIFQFALPAYALAILSDLADTTPWLIRGRPAGLLLLFNASVVWMLATYAWLVPSGTESWLMFGAIVVGAFGVRLLLRSPARVA